MSGGPDSCDVLIVGSGLSGLTSAYRVLQADCTRSVVVTDALDYFGGRTKSIDMPEYKTKVSVGGTFSLFEHHDTLNLAREVGCYPELNLPISGVNWNLFSQDLVGYLSTPLGLPLFLELMWKGSKVVNGGQILWDCSTARKLDKMSLETWINNQSLLKELNPNFTREFFYLLETYPDLATVSALQCAIALWVRFRGIPRNGFELPPQTLRWEGGTGVFTSALVDLLRSFGPNFRLLLNSPVDQIVQPQLGEATDDAYPVKVTINQDRTRKTVIRAKYVIVATSPLACAPRSRGGNIEYQPNLPNDATMLFSAINATPTVALNILVIYERPWWREYGGIMTLPEYSRHVHEKGVYGNVVDGSMSGDDVFGVARIFCDSRRVENWAEDEIKAGAIDFLKKLFPTDEQVRLVENFVEIRIWNWNNTKPTLPGVTFTFPPSGALSTYGHALTQPHGRIHWGGSERSVWGSGWMEGAVERGNDVAQEVLREAGWVPADYDVRNHGFIAAKSGGASPMAFLSEPPSDDEFSDDDIDSEWTELIPDAGSAKPKKSESKTAKSAPAVSSGAERSFVPKTRLDLVAHLFTDEQHRTMSYQAKLDHLGRIEKSADGSPHRISPQACLAALKELHDIKLQKSDSAACDGSRLFACPAGRAAGELEKASGCVLC